LLACEEEEVLVRGHFVSLADVFNLICLERLCSDKWLRESLVDATVPITVTVIRPIEVLLLDGDVAHALSSALPRVHDAVHFGRVLLRL